MDCSGDIRDRQWRYYYEAVHTEKEKEASNEDETEIGGLWGDGELDGDTKRGTKKSLAAGSLLTTFLHLWTKDDSTPLPLSTTLSLTTTTFIHLPRILCLP